jgi:hypothetical protein
MLNEKHKYRQDIRSFFQDCWQDHDSIAGWIVAYEQEAELPRERYTGETVVELRVIYGGRTLAADEVEKEVEGERDQEPPYSSGSEHNSSEFQGISSLSE